MRYFISILLLLVASQTYAQALYIKTFGNPKATPIIYLHGGPGYNSANFEATTAEKLAQKDFFVIVYDRRGEGRSEKVAATFTFQETIADLDSIYQIYNLDKATLIGHSFGGIIATLFAEKYPTKINQVVLLSAPIVMQEVFQNIIVKTEKIYQAKADKVNLNYIAMLKKMDEKSIEYSGYCFMHAMENEFYTPKEMTENAQEVYAEYRKNELFQYANQLSYTAPQGFWKNEAYTSIDLTALLSKLVAQKISFQGIYGKEDGLFSEQHIEQITKIIGTDNFNYLDNCSHNLFLDRQATFIKLLTQ